MSRLGEPRCEAGRRRQEQGAVVALVALWLPLLLALLLLADTAGRLLWLRQALYDGAEAAALAAVRQLEPEARTRGELRLDPAGAVAAATAVARANLARLPGGTLAEVVVAVYQAEPPPQISRASRGGRSVAGQGDPPAVAVTVRLSVTLPAVGRATVLDVTAWAGLRPEKLQE